MKLEWRKQYKDIYLPKNEPAIIELPEMTYLTISGAGDPSSITFSNCVEALYAMSYTLKMAPRKGINIPDYQEYSVFPLEGIWTFDQEGIKKYQNNAPLSELRNHFVFKLMIRQPDFISNSLFDELVDETARKKKNSQILKLRFEKIKEPLSCQMLHIGPYSEEPETFRIMEEYIIKLGYEREKHHKEIYISDPRKTESNKLKTVLRFEINKIDKR